MSLSVEAANLAEAKTVAKSAIAQYPLPIPHDNVKHMIVENREFSGPVVRELTRRIPIREDITNPS